MDKRVVFMNDDDYLRFIHDLFEFNDKAPADHVYHRRKTLREPGMQLRKMRKCPVEILAYVLMPNHFHLMLRQLTDGGVVQFMQKLGTGYTYYFNKKYERSGALFQGRFKAVLLENDGHFLYLPYYIHLNPLDLVAPEWREGRLEQKEKALSYLKTYRWSSHRDYAGLNNFPSVLHMELLNKSFGGQERYLADLERYIGLLHAPSAPTDQYIE